MNLENQNNYDLKYRPRTFKEVIGNTSNMNILIDAFKTGIIPRLMIFTGQPGTGKTTSAYITAIMLAFDLKEIDTTKINSPIYNEGNSYEQSISLKANNLFSLTRSAVDWARVNEIYEELYSKGTTSSYNGIYIFDIGAKSNTEYIQEIARNIKTKSVTKGKKIIILDELQMVELKNQDPLLKACEFIPEDTHIIITTSEPKKLSKALKSRADITLNFSYPTQEEAYKFIRDIIRWEQIRLSADDTKQLLIKNKNNLRQCLKDLALVKKSPEGALDLLIRDREDRYMKYLNFFKTINSNILELIFLIEELESQIEFTKGMAYFLKDYLKMTLTRKGFTKKFRDEVKNVLDRYTMDSIVEVMDEIRKTYFQTEEDAETMLISIAYRFNKSLAQQTVVKDNVLIDAILAKDREDEDEEILLNKVNKTNTLDSIGIELDKVVTLNNEDDLFEFNFDTLESPEISENGTSGALPPSPENLKNIDKNQEKNQINSTKNQEKNVENKDKSDIFSEVKSDWQSEKIPQITNKNTHIVGIEKFADHPNLRPETQTNIYKDETPDIPGFEDIFKQIE